jgi:hypothetical protein
MSTLTLSIRLSSKDLTLGFSLDLARLKLGSVLVLVQNGHYDGIGGLGSRCFKT